MRASLLFALVATARSALAKGPFLQQLSPTQWVFGNEIWNLTQGPTYATKLQYQGDDAVKGAPGHYAGYGMLTPSLHDPFKAITTTSAVGIFNNDKPEIRLG
jgi:hypothetical protein